MKRLKRHEQNQFRKSLKIADSEKGIEKAYQRLIESAFSDLVDDGYAWSTAHQTDGIFVLSSQAETLFGQYEKQNPGHYANYEVLKLLLETKFQQELMEHSVRCKTLLQALFYLKRIKDSNERLPNVILVGDCNECFVVAGSALHSYLEKNQGVDWTVAPSAAAECPSNREILLELIDDRGICPYVFEVLKEKVDLNDVINLISDIANRSELIKLKVDEKNIRLAYDSYINSVFRYNPDKIEPLLLVAIFIQTLTNPRYNYPLPGNPNILVFEDGKEHVKHIRIDGRAFTAFFSRYSSRFTPKEIDRIKSIADRLIEETKRRFRGDFWTPSIWADEGNRTIDQVLGENWREEYVVWDCCCGSKNLTRDYPFKKLYCSTLHQEELDMSREYNQKAIATFQMDFLNDDVELSAQTDPDSLTKIPPPLFLDLKDDKPIVFFCNPPFGTANTAGAKGKSKASIAKTKVNKIMLAEGAGKASQQLFAQFFWRIFKLQEQFDLTDVTIAFYLNPIFFSPSEYWTAFRKRLFSSFEFCKGFLFPAGDFADVKDNWGIGFVIFRSRKTLRVWDENKEYQWVFDLKMLNESKDKVIHRGNKTFWYWPSDYSMSNWIRRPIAGKSKIQGNFPALSSAIKCSDSEKEPSGTLVEGALGYMVNVANNVYNSVQDVWIVSSATYKGHGLSVCPENFERCMVNFAARRLVVDNWITHIDEFHIPSDQLMADRRFIHDCIVFSIFNTKSNQASVEDMNYLGKTFSFRNEWFPWSRDAIKNLAEKYENTQIYNDARDSKESFVYENYLVKKEDLSEESRKVLDIAWNVYCDSMVFRRNPTIDEKLRVRLYEDRWDAGWYQTMKLLEKNKPLPIRLDKTLKEFRAAYATLSEKIRKRIFDDIVLWDATGQNGSV